MFQVYVLAALCGVSIAKICDFSLLVEKNSPTAQLNPDALPFKENSAVTLIQQNGCDSIEPVRVANSGDLPQPVNKELCADTSNYAFATGFVAKVDGCKQMAGKISDAKFDGVYMRSLQTDAKTKCTFINMGVEKVPGRSHQEIVKFRLFNNQNHPNEATKARADQTRASISSRD